MPLPAYYYATWSESLHIHYSAFATQFTHYGGHWYLLSRYFRVFAAHIIMIFSWYWPLYIFSCLFGSASLLGATVLASCASRLLAKMLRCHILIGDIRISGAPCGFIDIRLHYCRNFVNAIITPSRQIYAFILVVTRNVIYGYRVAAGWKSMVTITHRLWKRRHDFVGIIIAGFSAVVGTLPRGVSIWADWLAPFEMMLMIILVYFYRAQHSRTLPAWFTWYLLRQ